MSEQKFEIFLTSDLYCVKEIKKKTQAEGFRDIQVGDWIELYVELRRQGRRSRGGRFAPQVTVINRTQKTSFSKDFNTIAEQLNEYLVIE